ncbi:energy coupling factor transporter S component ThiW [Streptococcus moroccensis]|uniref:Energy coupling factor transporter S component ThiW n=1 Tax=Streptococcus moroccensis TaxID=1451356 RepID=A0ABT9YTQ1_9STRE|nr:energy coupling factor transporter S component ThiW [Streptococcus moroccensis]MDQ0223376.1 energy coupling factor transporter S component ThiW [Streptococcus moroccensis]
MTNNKQLYKWLILTVMVSLDVVLSPILRIEGMAPMSSVVNIVAAMLMRPLYTGLMALFCGILRMTLMGIPPLALTGAVFGAVGAGLGAKYGRKIGFACLGEMIGTGIIGSLLSYPVMVWFTGTKTALYWFVYTPRFLGATLIGSFAAVILWRSLKHLKIVQDIQNQFKGKGEIA